LVLKAARGGYDGRGVWPVSGRDEAHDVCRRAEERGLALLVEPLIDIRAELAVMVARQADGTAVHWPAVSTWQLDGVCREVLVPAAVPAWVAEEAVRVAGTVADIARAVGALAVELFWAEDRVMVNEIAARPHNSGHWSIEGSVTSQFENHLRAVLDLPLGSTALTAPHTASVNVFGAQDGGSPSAGLPRALSVEGAHVHLYGKEPRPGRKLGHVTVCAGSAQDARQAAWAAARALGTPPVGRDAADSPPRGGR
jgi:5-(carboxyamino)imidazole ribonucleotide synthase